MAEQLAELRQKGGGGVPSNIFSASISPSGSVNTWSKYSFVTTTNDPNGVAVTVMLDPKYGHINDGSIVVDKAIPKAYISGIAYSGRNASGTLAYSGIRVKKNGTVITGASIMGNSSTPQPTFRRVQESFAVGDIITVELNYNAGGNQKEAISIVTDD